MTVKTVFFAFVLGACATVLRAQTSFTATLDTNRIRIGEQTTLTLTATGISATADVRWPAWPDSLTQLEVLAVSGDTTIKNDLYTINQHYVITSFDSGFVLIPPCKLEVDNQQWETEPLMLNVSTVALDPTKTYFDIKGPVAPPFDWWYWIKRLWAVAALAALLIAVLLWFWLRKRQQEKAAKEPEDLRTPAQRAKDELQALLAERLWQKDQVKAYYSRATDITRTYIQESFGIAAMEMVTDELLENMKPNIPTAVYDRLKHVLQTADMVKFAKVKPAPETHEALWQNCMDIISLTEPKPTPHDA